MLKFSLPKDSQDFCAYIKFVAKLRNNETGMKFEPECRIRWNDLKMHQLFWISCQMSKRFTVT